MGVAAWVHDEDLLNYAHTGLDDSLVCVLTYRQVFVLVGWLEHLRYDTAWRGEQQAPLDFLDRLACDLMGTSIEEITTRLDAILLAIQGNSAGAASCCDLPRGTVVGLPDGGSPLSAPVPQSVIDAGFATDESDYSGMADYLCYSGDLIIDNMLWKVDRFSELLEGGLVTVAAIANVLAAFSSGGATLVASALILDAVAIWNHLTDLTDVLLFDQLKDVIEGLRQDVGCAASNGAEPSIVCDIVQAAADATGGLVGLMLPLLGWKPIIQGVYDGVDANGKSIASTIDQSEPCTPACNQTVEIFVEYGTVDGLSNQYIDASVGQSWDVASEVASHLAGSTEDVSMSVQDANKSVTIRVDIVEGTVVNTDSCKSEEAYYTVPAVYNVCADLYQPYRILEECISLRVRSTNFPDIETPYTARFTVLSIVEHP